MAKKHTKQILTEEQHERFDLLMDSNLQNAVHKEITKRFYKLEYHEEKSLMADDFLENLKTLDIEIFKDKKHTNPYQDCYWGERELTLLQFKNFDCCLNVYSSVEVSLEFKKGTSYYDIRITNFTIKDVIDLLLQLDKDMPTIIKTCKADILKEEKKAKMKALSKATVSSVVKATLKGTGIKYKLDLHDSRAYLTVKLDYDLETKFALSYKDFMKKIVHVTSTVEQLNTIMRNLGQPLRIKGSYFRTNNDENWEESK